MAFFVMSLVLITILPVKVSAAANSTLTFQSKIVNKSTGLNVTNGSPSCVASGADTCDFRVSIYSDPSSGTLLWQETETNVEIGSNNGILNLNLNAVCSSWTTPSAPGCAGSGLVWGNDPTVYVQVEWDADGNGDFVSAETFARQLIAASSYAYFADVAGSANALVNGLDTAYTSDSDQTLNVNNVAGLTFNSSVTGNINFNLGSTGDLTVQDNGTTFFTLDDQGGLSYIASAATNPNFTITNLGTSSSFRVNDQSSDTTPFYIDDSGKVAIQGTTPSALLDIASATTSNASLRIRSSAGTNPSTPNSGDVWWNGTNLNFYTGSTTVDLLSAASGTFVNFTPGTAQTTTSTNNLINIATTANTSSPLVVFNENGAGTPDLLNLQVAGTNKLKINNNGTFTTTPTVSNGSTTTTGSGTNRSIAVANSANFDVGSLILLNGATYELITSIPDGTHVRVSHAVAWTAGQTLIELTAPDIGDAANAQNRYGTGYFLNGITTGFASTVYKDQLINSASGPLEINTVDNQDVILGTGRLAVGGVTNPSAYIDVAGATTAQSSIRLEAGVAPSAPNAGDIWWNGTNFNFYTGTQTIDLLANVNNVLFAPASQQTTTSTNSLVNVATTGNTANPLIVANENGAGTPTLLSLQVAGTPVFTVSNAGAVTAVGVNSGSGLIQGTGGATVTGVVSINASNNSAVNINTGTSTGAVTIGGTGTQTIAIGNGAGAKTVNLGSATGASITTILSGSGGININNNNNQPVNVGTGTSTGTVTLGGTGTQTIAIGNGAGVKTVNVGSTNTTSTTTISAGTGGLTLDAGTGNINIGNSANAKIINLGTGTAADTINIGNGGTTADTINIGNSATANTLVLGSAASSLTINSSGITVNSTGDTTVNSLAIKSGAFTTTFNSGTQAGNIAYTLPTASANGILRNTAGTLSWDTSTYLTSAGTGNLTTSTSGISVIGGTGAVVGSGTTVDIATASGSQNGLLSSTDFTAFSGKENALTFSTGLTRTVNTITNNLSTGIAGGQTINGGTASGEGLTIDSTTNAVKGTISINNTGGTVNVANGTTTQTVNIATGLAAKTVNIGSTNSTSTTTLNSGSGGINLNVNNNQPTNINSGSSTGTVTIGGGSDSVVINSSTTKINAAGVASGLTGLSSSGTITFSALNVAGGFVRTDGSGNLSSSVLTSSDLNGMAVLYTPAVQQTTTSTNSLISVATTANTANALIVANENGAGTPTLLSLQVAGTPVMTVSNSGAVTAVGVDSGTGLIQGTGGATVTGAINLNNNATTNTTNIGTGTTTGTVTIGGTGTQAINVGTGAGAKTVTVGSTNTTSTTTINGGSGGVIIDAGTNAINIGTSANNKTVQIATVGTNTLSLGNPATTGAFTTNTWSINGAGAASGLTGVSSSGTITFSALNVAGGIVRTDGSGNLSSSVFSASDLNGLAVLFTPAAPQTTSSTNSLINVVTTANTANALIVANENGAGTPNLLSLQVAGTPVMTVSNAGAITGVGVNSGTGLLQGTGGATLTGTLSLNDTAAANTTSIGGGTTTGAVTIGGTGTQTINVGNGAGVKTVNIGSSNTTSTTTILSGSGGLTLNNNNGANTTSIGTGTTTGAITIGGGSNTVQINSSNWKVSTAGVATGLTGFTSSGTITLSSLTTAGGFVRTNGSGVLSSTVLSAADLSGFGFVQNGNSFGTGAILGTNDLNNLGFETNNVTRAYFDTTGGLNFDSQGSTDPNVFSKLLFTNTAGTGDFRIGADGGDIFWQGGGARNLQMGAYWGMDLIGHRQTAGFPTFVAGAANYNTRILNQLNDTVGLILQGFTTQTNDLLQVKNSAGTILDGITGAGNVFFGATAGTTDQLYVADTAAATSANAQQINYTQGANAANITGAGLVINATGSNQAGDTLYGLQIGNFTGTAATENAIQIGSGWDKDINFTGTTNTIGVGNTSTTNVINAAGNNLVTLRDYNSNFGAMLSAGAFIDRNSKMAEEFNYFRPTRTSDTTGANSGAMGDDGNWGVYENTNCTFTTVTDTVNGILRMQSNAASSGCLITPDAAANNPSLKFNVANLPVMEVKMAESTTAANNRGFIGYSNQTDGSITDPTEFIGFTDNGGTTWTARTTTGGTTTSVTCTGQTIVANQYALGMIEVRSASNIHFFIDADVTDGIQFTECGTGISTNIPTGNLASQAIWQARAGGTANQALLVDFIRAWQDDLVEASATPLNITEIAANYADNSSLAQFFPADDLETPAGTLMALDNSSNTLKVKPSATAYDKNLVGVVVNQALELSNGSFDGVRVAIGGRAVVNATTEGGEIQVGDYVTSSSTAGAVMKATKAGAVIGQAVTSIVDGQIVIQIKPAYFNGIGLASLVEGLTQTADLTAEQLLAPKTIHDDMGQNLLAYFAQNKPVAGELKASEIFTDRVAAALEIDTPTVQAEQIFTKSIQAPEGSDLSVVIGENNTFIIKSKDGKQLAVVDNKGNATFAGTVTADTLAANQIQGLELIVNNIKSQLDGQVAGLSTTSGDVNLNTVTISSAKIALNLTVLGQIQANGGIVITGDATFNGNATFNGQAQFNQNTLFSQDSAGYALIKQGAESVDIKYTTPISQVPLVVANISSATETTSGTVLAEDVKFVITNQSAEGFTIKLNKATTFDIKFNWVAMTVKDAKTTESKPVVKPVDTTTTDNTQTDSDTQTNPVTPDTTTQPETETQP